MKNKEEKAQETETRRPYEKPVLIVISTAQSRGKLFNSFEITTIDSNGPS